jgi:hypothetical protein
LTVVATVGRCVNTVVIPLVQRWSGWPQRVGGRGMGVVSYEGRRTGRPVRLVVGFRRTESGVDIAVEMPDQKRWWRNFTGEGWPAVIEAGGQRHPGHGVATRDSRSGVQVTIKLGDSATETT